MTTENWDSYLESMDNEEEKALREDLDKQINLFNKYNDSTMRVEDTGWDMELYIDNKKITESCDTEILRRVKGINHEHAYDFLDE